MRGETPTKLEEEVEEPFDCQVDDLNKHIDQKRWCEGAYPSIHFDDRTLITQWHCDCVRCGLWLVSMCVVLCLVCGDDLMCDVIDV